MGYFDPARIVDIQTAKMLNDWLLVGPKGFDFNKKVPRPNAPHLQTILRSNTSSQDGLLKWLEKEHLK